MYPRLACLLNYIQPSKVEKKEPQWYMKKRVYYKILYVTESVCVIRYKFLVDQKNYK